MFRRICFAVAATALFMQPVQAKADTGDVVLGVIGGIVLKSVIDGDRDRKHRPCDVKYYEHRATYSKCNRVGRAPRRGYYSPEEYEEYNRRRGVMQPAYTCDYYKFVDKYDRVFYKEVCQ